MQVPMEDPYECVVDLPDWQLHAAFLVRREERDLGNVMEVALRGAIANARRNAPDGRVDRGETAASIREQLIEMGLDPAHPAPASEQLIARVLEDPEAASGPLAWQFLVLLSLNSQAPWTVVSADRISPPLRFRPGRAGEELPNSALPAEGLPVLADQNGVVASPWTLPDPDELAECTRPVFFCFLPGPLFRRIEPMAWMGRTVWSTWAFGFVWQRSYRPRRARS